MLSTNDFKTGVTIEIDGDAYIVVDFQHVKPGKGAAFVRSKLKNLKSGSIIEKTFRAGEKVPKAHVDRKEMQFLYNSGGLYYFMDTETFEQISLQEENLGGSIQFIKENMIATVLFFEGSIIGIELPTFVELEVVETEPGFKGDTATGGTKPAKLETGALIQVPLFIETGDIVKIDTRIGEYISRV